MTRVKQVLIWIGLVLVCLAVAVAAQDRQIHQGFSISGTSYTFTGSVEGWNQLQLQIKINNLLCDVLADEAKGLHPYAKIALIKKLTKQLEE